MCLYLSDRFLRTGEVIQSNRLLPSGWGLSRGAPWGKKVRGYKVDHGEFHGSPIFQLDMSTHGYLQLSLQVEHFAYGV